MSLSQQQNLTGLTAGAKHQLSLPRWQNSTVFQIAILSFIITSVASSAEGSQFISSNERSILCQMIISIWVIKLSSCVNMWSTYRLWKRKLYIYSWVSTVFLLWKHFPGNEASFKQVQYWLGGQRLKVQTTPHLPKVLMEYNSLQWISCLERKKVIANQMTKLYTIWCLGRNLAVCSANPSWLWSTKVSREGRKDVHQRGEEHTLGLYSVNHINLLHLWAVCH